MKTWKISLLLVFLPFYALAAAGGGVLIIWHLFGPSSRRGADTAKLAEALRLVEKRYNGEVSRDKILDAALRGMTAELDPYCEYLSAQDWKDFDDTHLRGKFGGVGIVIENDRPSGFVRVLTPIEDTPAFAADILPGDVVREVDGKSVKGQPLQDVVRRIKGVPGTRVTLTVGRGGREPFQVKLVRAMIRIRAVKAKMLDDGIGYVRITDFTEMMSSFDEEVKKLQAAGMKALVLDLRFNGGGLLSECVELADRFLDEGAIVTTRGRTADDSRALEAKKGDTLPDLPLVVLVNEATASASEIFAGAMKDHGRGVLVGARTFGKGSVQTPFPLGDGSYLKITTSRYYTPKGTSVHREEGKKEYGLEPDFRVEMSPEEYGRLMSKWNQERIVKADPDPEAAKAVDFQLDAGLEVIRARLKGARPNVAARILQKEKDKPSDN